MNKIFLAPLVLLLNNVTVKSQAPDFHKYFTIKPSYTHVLKAFDSHQFRFEVDYRVNRFTDMGAYLGYRRINTSNSHYLFTQPPHKSHTPSFGLVGNIHLFPIFIKKDNFRFDLYASFKAGGYHIFSNTEHLPFKGVFEYGFYGGAGINLSRRIGVFIEYGTVKSGTGKYDFLPRKTLSYGLNIKLDGKLGD